MKYDFENLLKKYDTDWYRKNLIIPIEKIEEEDYSTFEVEMLCVLSINALFEYREVFENITHQEISYCVLLIQEGIRYLTEKKEQQTIEKIKNLFNSCLNSMDISFRSEDRTEEEISKYLEWKEQMRLEYPLGFLHETISKYLENKKGEEL